MKFKHFLLAALVGAAVFTASADINKSTLSARRQAHQEQLANRKSRLDHQTITNIISKDLDSRDSKNGFSKESSRLVDDLLKEAYRHIGTPYIFGAKGPKAFDCSGFTSYVYKQLGFDVISYSRAQFKQGEPVDRKNLRKGDLVFFTSRSSGSNVGHVGIVVKADNATGDFEFIHASTSKGVKVSACEGYYQHRYVGARRIIDK